MSDAFFDADRLCGTYPPKGFGWLDEDRQKVRVLEYFAQGRRDPWMYQWSKEHGMVLPAEYQPYQG
jgi:hypothetical protein